MNLTHSVLLGVMAVLLSGCAGSQLNQSYVDPSLTPSDAALLSQDLISHLKQYLPAAQTTVVLANPVDDSGADVLTTQLVFQLRSQGYGVALADPKATQGKDKGVPLGYLVTPLDGGLLLRLYYQDRQLSRYYPRDAQGQLLATLPFSLGGRAP